MEHAMTRRSWLYVQRGLNNEALFLNSGTISSTNSPRDSRGRLVLRPNVLGANIVKSWDSTVYRSDLVRPGIWSNPTYDGTARSRAIFSNAPSIDYSDLTYDVVRKWYSQAGGFSANVAEMFATRQESIDMVTSRVRKIALIAEALAKRNPRAVMNLTGLGKPISRRSLSNKSGPQLWLEYQYGWKPLAMDIDTIVNAKLKLPYSHVTASRRKTFPSVYSGVSATGWTTNTTWNQVATVRVAGIVTATNIPLSTARQFGLTNLASLVWELLPYSFLLDWVIDVGGYLESWTAMSGTSVSLGSVTTTVKRDMKGSVVYNGGSKSIRYSGDFSFSESSRSKGRVVGIPAYPLPRLKNPLSLTHFANATALLATNLHRLGRS